jgi:DNA segregation ATPase FtsK/SpoIIIE, S-DNA-T family
VSAKITRSATSLGLTVVTKTRSAPSRAPARSAPKKTAKKPAARAKRAAPQRPPFWRVQARDLWAVGLITLGVLLALALWGQQLGPVGHGTNTGLASLAGWARILLPLVAVGAGGTLLFDRRLRDEYDEDDEAGGQGADPWRLVVGIVLGLLGICGLAELGKSAPALSDSHALREGGGYLGVIVGRPLHAGLGSAGATVLLVAVVVVAILVATGASLASVGRALRTGVLTSGRVAAELWRGKPFVIVPEGSTTDLGGAASSGADDVVPEAGDLQDEDPTDGDDTDIDIPLDPEPEPEPALEPEPDLALPVVAATSRGPGEWTLPKMSLLHQSKKLRQDQRQIDAAGEELVRALAAHGVETRLVGCRVGPTVTRYEIELGPGVKVARVTSLSKDIAYAMASPDVRILAPIPGKSAIGVEVPNRTRQLVSLRDILESREARSGSGHPLEVAMGRDIAGRAVMANLAEMPHILISGSTGSGKSSCMNSIITSVLMRDTPDKVKMILVDPKRVELGQYDGLPHLLNPVVVDPKKAANALAWAVKEMERRYDILAENGVRDITGYNQLVEEGRIAASPSDRRRSRDAAARVLGEDHPAVEDEAGLDDEPEAPQTLPFILVIVDELNDLMMVAARDVEDSIVRIAQMARAVGIHLVIATQRPSVDVITGVIKANIPSRMAFSVSSLADSRVILDQPGAERLIGKGDMLLLTASSNISRRLQAPWVSEEEVRDVVQHWRSQGGQTEAIVGIEGIDDGALGANGVDDDDDEYLSQARDLVVRSQLGSTSMLQRKLRVGFARAGRLMDLLEQAGVVGPSEGSKARAVLMTPEELDALSRR